MSLADFDRLAGPARAVPKDWHALIPPGAPRFLIAGGLASLINWSVRFPLSALLPFDVAVGLAYVVGMAAGFGLYRAWVFPGSTLPLGRQIAGFILVNSGGIGIVIFGAMALAHVIGWTGLLPTPAAEGLAHGIAILFGAVVNFLGHRAVTFARGKPSRAASPPGQAGP